MWMLFLLFQGAQPLDSGLDKLQFLLGHWETVSTYPDGTQAKGILTYESVLGGAWIKFTFVGDHPTRPVWEAHGMIHDTPDGFESFAFFNADPPTHMPGSWQEPGFFRSTNEQGDGGIDYYPTEDGVYQENWHVENGERKVTLRTHYSRMVGFNP